MRSHPVAILGTGPVGLAAALGVVKQGGAPLLIGPQTDRADPRTTAILGASLDGLKDIGILDGVSAIGTPLDTMRIVDMSRRLLRARPVAFDAHEAGLSTFGLNVANGDLNAVLEDAVEKAGVERIFARAMAIQPNEEGVGLTLDTHETIACEALIAADGLSSPSREAAGITTREWSHGQSAMIALLSHKLPHHNASSEFHTEEGPCTVVPLEGNRSSLVWMAKAARAEELAALEPEAFARAVEAEIGSFLGAMTLESPVRVWPLKSLVANRFAEKSVFLVGEAAHGFPPIGAQGFNLGLRDALAAARITAHALKRGEKAGSARAIEAYHKDRRSDVWSRAAGVDLLNRSLLSSIPLFSTGRAVLFGLAASVPAARKALMRLGLDKPTLNGLLTGVAASR